MLLEKKGREHTNTLRAKLVKCIGASRIAECRKLNHSGFRCGLGT